MEVDKHSPKELNRTWTSEGKFKLQWSQSFRECVQVENRLKILELEKQKKIKDIERKLWQHKKNVQIKISKHNRFEDIEKVREEEKNKVNQYHSQFQSSKRQRSANIQNLRLSILKANYQEYKNVKKQRQENQKIRCEQRTVQMQEKTKKRNRVRMMEIEAKQNIVSSWNARLHHMKENRKKLLEKKAKQHQNNNMRINKMEKKERKLLDQVFNSQKMEQQLEEMITDERKMSGKELEMLYKTT